MAMQTRTIDFEYTTRNENGEPVIEGKFITFTGEYPISLHAIERIAPDLEIEGDDIRALTNHDTRLVLGRTTANTLTLERKNDGIYGIIKVNPKDSDAMNTYARVERRDVSQCSFGFDILSEDTEFLDDDSVVYTIRKIRLYEVSVCTFPAYEDTGVEARSKDADRRKNELWKHRMMAKLKGEK